MIQRYAMGVHPFIMGTAPLFCLGSVGSSVFCHPGIEEIDPHRFALSFLRGDVVKALWSERSPLSQDEQILESFTSLSFALSHDARWFLDTLGTEEFEIRPYAEDEIKFKRLDPTCFQL